MQMPSEPGYIFCKSYRHHKTGKVIVHPTGYFRFPIRESKGDKSSKSGTQPPSNT